MQTFNPYLSSLILAADTLALPDTISQAADGNSLAGLVWTPETFQWKRIEADGTKYAVLGGDRDQPGKLSVFIRVGGFFFVSGGVPHIEGSQGECLIVGTALGGWKTTNLE